MSSAERDFDVFDEVEPAGVDEPDVVDEPAVPQQPAPADPDRTWADTDVDRMSTAQFAEYLRAVRNGYFSQTPEAPEQASGAGPAEIGYGWSPHDAPNPEEHGLEAVDWNDRDAVPDGLATIIARAVAGYGVAEEVAKLDTDRKIKLAVLARRFGAVIR
jgi:hypothetical protein